MPAISAARLRKAIRGLPPDKAKVTPGKWYLTQKEHWIGWLGEYGGPGAYGRKTKVARDAQFAYNHIVEVEMLLWLAKAAGVPQALVRRAHVASASGKTLMQRSASVRALVPWSEVAKALFSKPVAPGRNNLP